MAEVRTLLIQVHRDTASMIQFPVGGDACESSDEETMMPKLSQPMSSDGIYHDSGTMNLNIDHADSEMHLKDI